jgi:hypothetical protein
MLAHHGSASGSKSSGVVLDGAASLRLAASKTKGKRDYQMRIQADSPGRKIAKIVPFFPWLTLWEAIASVRAPS